MIATEVATEVIAMIYEMQEKWVSWGK